MSSDKEFDECVKKLQRSMKALYLCLGELVADDINGRINAVMNGYEAKLGEKDKEIERLKADINKAVELIEENNSILRNNHSIFHLNEEVINILKQALREVESD